VCCVVVVYVLTVRCTVCGAGVPVQAVDND